MKKQKTHSSFFSEALSNVQLLLAYLLHYRHADAFISKQNITSVL